MPVIKIERIVERIPIDAPNHHGQKADFDDGLSHGGHACIHDAFFLLGAIFNKR